MEHESLGGRHVAKCDEKEVQPKQRDMMAPRGAWRERRPTSRTRQKKRKEDSYENFKNPRGFIRTRRKKKRNERARARHETAAAERPGPTAEGPQTARRTANADHGRGNVMDEVHHDVGRHECRDHD